jgi:hypothetical protein
MRYHCFCKYKRLFIGHLLITFIFLLTSCEEVMNIKMSGDSAKNLAVEGSITTDTKSHRVVLSYTGDFFGKPGIEMATGAEVSIYDGNTTFLLHEDTTGVYITDDTVHGQIGRTYTLNIKLADSREYTASDYLNPCADFDSIAQTANYNSYFNGYGYDVLFYGREPEPAGNYYMFLLYKDDVLYSDTITEVFFSNDDFINGLYIQNYTVYRIREIDMLEEPAFITLEMYSINRKYYEFLTALMTETIWKGSPWDGPPANIPGNISNGAKGYFMASDVKRHSKLFMWTPRMN